MEIAIHGFNTEPIAAGSSVEFSCSYPSHIEVTSIQGWSQIWHPEPKPAPLDMLPAYKVRMSYPGSNGNCTMKLANLTTKDAATYYFVYKYRHRTADQMTCNGIPGVRLHVFASPVHIVVETIVSGQKTLVKDWTVMEGQSILLTCSRTCAENLNSYSGYIWYKNRLQLNTSQVNSFYLSLHPVSKEDAGSYVCVLIGYKDFPSSAVNLIVQNRPRSIMSGESDDSRHENDSLPLPRSPKGKSLFRFPVVLVASVCFGLAVVITVAVVFARIYTSGSGFQRPVS
uniref:Ig-like domain-containing protein n=1 Tax=Stegastes partitus TaxID=144197 RepID=A0A3B5AKC4_9TELE